MKSILFLITCSLCAFCCFAAAEATTLQVQDQEFACSKCNKSSCRGCKGGVMLTCGDDENCPCGCEKRVKQEIAGCGCKGKGKGINQACSSCKKKKRSVIDAVTSSTTFLNAC